MKKTLEITHVLPAQRMAGERRRIVLAMTEPVMRRLFQAAGVTEGLVIAAASEESDVLDHVAWSLVDGAQRRRLDAVVLDARRKPKAALKLLGRLRKVSPELRIAVLVEPTQQAIAAEIRQKRATPLALPADARVVRHIVRELAPTALDRIVGLVWPLGTS